jgi:SAM-dependent methyltransferase
MALDNLLWEDKFNLYARILKKLATHTERETDDELYVSNELFDKIEGIYTNLSELYLKNRPELDAGKSEFNIESLVALNTGLGALHDNLENHEPGLTPLQIPEFGFQDDECLKITELVEERLTQEDLTTLSNIAFNYWRSHQKLGDPNSFAFDDKGQRIPSRGIPHLNNANDYFGKEVYDRFEGKILEGEEIRILDLGSGTGDTVEAIVNWVYTLAREDGIADKINLKITGVEYNEALAGDFMTKAGNLQAKYTEGSLEIDVVNEDMISYSAKAAQGDEKYDVVSSSYAMHHCKKESRKEIMKNANTALNNNGIFLRADPDKAMSWINKFYFNITDEGTFASFDSGLDAAVDLENSEFMGMDVLRDEVYKDRITALVGETVLEELRADYDQHKGYVVAGLKQAE